MSEHVTRPVSTRHLFVTGGVASSLGKGLTASSLGRLLKLRGLRVNMQKLDPYLNVDPGTMNPFQHGEVFVTDDGDGDRPRRRALRAVPGHPAARLGQRDDRARSTPASSPRSGAATTWATPSRSSRTSPMRSRPASWTWAARRPTWSSRRSAGRSGDIESQPFLEAIRQIRHEIGRDRCFFLHVSLLPYIGPSGELKTKPTQHSVAALRSIGIQPDAIVCRSDRPISAGLKRKISLMCDVDEEAVVSAPDAPSIYDIPKVLHTEGLDAYVVRKLGLSFRDVDWTDWDDLLRRVHRPARSVTIALVGKYVDLPDAYLSPAEALRAGGFANDAKVNIRWVPSDDCQTPEGAAEQLADVGRGADPRRFRGPRHRGQDRRRPVRPRARHPGAGPVPRPAVHGHRGRPRPGRAGRRQQRRVRPRCRLSRHRHHGRPAGRGGGGAGHGRDHAAGHLPGRPDRRQPGRRAVRHGGRRTSGTGTATRSTTPTARRWRRPGWSAPGCRRTGGWSSSWSCRATCTRSSSPPRPIPSSCPGPPGRTRCSAAWWPPPSSGPGPCRRAAAPRRPAARGQRPCGCALGWLRPHREPGPRPAGSRAAGPGGGAAVLRLGMPSAAGHVRAARHRFLHVRRDTVVMPAAARLTGRSSSHPGAVGHRRPGRRRDRVLMIRQYRHAAGRPAVGDPGRAARRRGGAAADRRAAGAAGGDRRTGPRTGRCWPTSWPRRAAAPSGADLPGPRRDRGAGRRAGLRPRRTRRRRCRWPGCRWTRPSAGSWPVTCTTG